MSAPAPKPFREQAFLPHGLIAVALLRIFQAQPYLRSKRPLFRVLLVDQRGQVREIVRALVLALVLAALFA